MSDIQETTTWYRADPDLDYIPEIQVFEELAWHLMVMSNAGIGNTSEQAVSKSHGDSVYLKSKEEVVAYLIAYWQRAMLRYDNDLAAFTANTNTYKSVARLKLLQLGVE